jgi:hypothetical protein
MIEYLTKVAAQRRARRGRDQEKLARGESSPSKNPTIHPVREREGEEESGKAATFSRRARSNKLGFGADARIDVRQVQDVVSVG